MCNPLGFTFLIANSEGKVQEYKTQLLECVFLMREKEAGVKKKKEKLNRRVLKCFVRC